MAERMWSLSGTGNFNGERMLQATGRDTSGTTDARGQYTIRAVLPGRYYVRVSVSAYQKAAEAARASVGLAPVYYPNAAALSGAVSVEVSAGTATDAIDFRLRPTAGFHLRGTASGNLGDGVHVVTVHALHPGLSDDAGRLSLRQRSRRMAPLIPNEYFSRYILSSHFWISQGSRNSWLRQGGSYCHRQRH